MSGAPKGLIFVFLCFIALDLVHASKCNGWYNNCRYLPFANIIIMVEI